MSFVSILCSVHGVLVLQLSCLFVSGIAKVVLSAIQINVSGYSAIILSRSKRYGAGCSDATRALGDWTVCCAHAETGSAGINLTQDQRSATIAHGSSCSAKRQRPA